MTGIQIVELQERAFSALGLSGHDPHQPYVEGRFKLFHMPATASARGYLFEEINSKGVLYCSPVRINLSCEVRVCADGFTIPVITQPLNESRLSVLRTRLCIRIRVFRVSGASGYEQDDNPELLHNFTSGWKGHNVHFGAVWVSFLRLDTT